MADPYTHRVDASCDCLACQMLRERIREINRRWREAMDAECARILGATLPPE